MKETQNKQYKIEFLFEKNGSVTACNAPYIGKKVDRTMKVMAIESLAESLRQNDLRSILSRIIRYFL